MPVKLKIKEKPRTKKFMEFLTMPEQRIKVGTNINYGIKGGFDVFGLSNILEYGGSAGRNGSVEIPGWGYNEKALKQFKIKGERLFKTGIDSIIKGRGTLNSMLNKIGIEAAEDYKKVIEDIKTPGNAEVTILHKGFDNPMIEKGYFKFNITAEINGGRNVR